MPDEAVLRYWDLSITPCIVPMGSKRHARQWKSVRLHVTDRYSFLPAQRGRTVPNLFFPLHLNKLWLRKFC